MTDKTLETRIAILKAISAAWKGGIDVGYNIGKDIEDKYKSFLELPEYENLQSLWDAEDKERMK